jgi:endoglucanase
MEDEMSRIFTNQVGFFSGSPKKAVLDFPCEEFDVRTVDGKIVYTGNVTHFGSDEVSGEDTYVADFSDFTEEGKFRVLAGEAESSPFVIGPNAYDSLMRDVCKCYYYLRCGDALSKDYAGDYYHEPCHMDLATIYGSDEKKDVMGGWHDAGDYGRYSTAGSVAVAHLLYGVRFFKGLCDVEFDIPKVPVDGGTLPDILAEVRVELNFLMKMQRDDGAVYHKVTTFCHAPFEMPEDDKEELFLFAVSSIATADVAAVMALAYTVYKDCDKEYADKLMECSLRAYSWLESNPEALLFYNVPGSNTGEYDEAEDFSNRFWAAASLYEATGDKKYKEDALLQKEKVLEFDRNAEKKGYQGDVLTCLGWAEVAGLGALSILLKQDGDELEKEIRERFVKEADRLIGNAKENGFGLCMKKEDFIWGSNMELLKYMMILTVTDKVIKPSQEYKAAVHSGLDYLLGCNSMDTSYVTGNGEKAYRNPHLRPTAVDNIEDPWPGLVSGGPNRGLQDEIAMTLPKDLAPMKCYIDHVQCYSLNEITIYWNSPLVFVLASMM